MRYLYKFSLALVLISNFGIGHVVAKVQPWVEGNIKVLDVKGDVSSGTKLQIGSFIKEGALVSSSSGSMAVLLFDNGSVVEVGEGTNLKINRYQVVAFDASKVDYKTLREEPRASITKLEVTRGSIICKVPKLSQWERNTSSYTITTPMGVAHVKGTVVHVRVSDNLDTFVVTEGVVLVQKGSESFYVHGANNQNQEAQANSDNSVVISNDPNMSLPDGLLNQMGQEAKNFSNSVGQMLTSNSMSTSPQQTPVSTDSDAVGPDAGSAGTSGVPSFPAPFGGGGGGSGGGGMYSN
jgi:hypothetical protein